MNDKNSTAEKYMELLNEVKNKIPGETRHETALRLIKQPQKEDNPPEAV